MKPCVRFALALFVWALFFSLKSIFAVALAVALHELGHLMACRKLGIKVLSMMPLPWGMTIATPLIYNKKMQIAVSLAGPFCNFATLIVFLAIKKIFRINSVFWDFFMIADFADGFLNLLPVLPLDGGIVLKAFLCEKYGLAGGFAKCIYISALVGSVVLVLGFGVMLATGYNFSYFAAGLFVLGNLRHERDLLLCIKKKVFTGEITPGEKLRCISVESDCHALCLANLITPSHSIVFLVNENGRFKGEVSQSDLLKKLFENTLITIGECVEKF